VHAELEQERITFGPLLAPDRSWAGAPARTFMYTIYLSIY
jgi:hypothetical protein